MPSKYILVVNGKPEGPYIISELKAMGLKPGDFVKTDAMDDYKEAHEVAELRAAFGFPLQTVMPQYFGSFDQRVLASVIDWLLVSGVFLVITLIVTIIISNRQTRLELFITALAIIPIANLIYHIVMEGSARQATYGKLILKIRVCDVDGSLINYGKAATRNLAKMLSASTFLIGYLISFFNKKQQCLHDIIAGTLVIKDRLI